MHAPASLVLLWGHVEALAQGVIDLDDYRNGALIFQEAWIHVACPSENIARLGRCLVLIHPNTAFQQSHMDLHNGHFDLRTRQAHPINTAVTVFHGSHRGLVQGGHAVVCVGGILRT